MEASDLIAEAERQLTVCNACRYCEGYCAVFPAIESRRTFALADVEQIANLCHDCRDCFYACQYAPPHEFAINLPKVFAEVRQETYAHHARPRAAARVLGRSAAAWPLPALLALVVGLVATLASVGGALGSVHIGPGAFYEIVPELFMEVLFSVLGLFWLVSWLGSAMRFWRATQGGGPRAAASLPALLRAMGDALVLRYLGGGGQGCTYPREQFSQTRRVLHHLVAYGFALDFASTTLAAFYDHVLGIPAPYPFLSPVVLLGTLGGIGIVVGSAGLLLLKAEADGDATSRAAARKDSAFLASLLQVAATGLLLLSLRDTALMGTLLVVHLSTVFALFVTAPYGKFVHLVYRFVALVRHAAERGQGAGASHRRNHAASPGADRKA